MKIYITSRIWPFGKNVVDYTDCAKTSTGPNFRIIGQQVRSSFDLTVLKPAYIKMQNLDSFHLEFIYLFGLLNPLSDE